MAKYKTSLFNVLIDRDEAGRSLIFNTGSGAVAWIEKNLMDLILNADAVDDSELPTDVVRLGYIVPSNIDEVQTLLFRKKSYIYGDHPSTLSYVIAPTTMCNYHCLYCFEQSHLTSVKMSAAIWEQVYDFIAGQICKFSEAKRLHLTWFGGEPCLAFNEIVIFSEKIIKLARQNGLSFSSSIVSNGLLLDYEHAIALKEKCALTRVQVTLDGNREHYACLKGCSVENFDKVVENIRSISSLFDVRIRINVNRYNQNSIRELIDYLMLNKELNGIIIYFANIMNYLGDLSDTTLTTTEFECFRKSMIDYMIEHGFGDSLELTLPVKIATPCTAIKNYNCVIGPQGELYRCEHCLGMKEWEIGSVTEGFYHNAKDVEFLDYSLPPKCHNCSLLPVCAGGCIADQLLDGIAFDCDVFRKKIQHSVKIAVQAKVSEQKLGKPNSRNKSLCL